MSGFNTFQTVVRYEEALGRHGQHIRWMQGLTCPCIQQDTGQSDPHCTMCKGRGKLYSTPEKFTILNERCKHDNSGRVFPLHGAVVEGSAVVTCSGVILPLSAEQPVDGAYVLLEAPYPRVYEAVYMTYDITMDTSITSENSDVIGDNTLKTIGTRFSENGKTFEGSLKNVSRVYNATKDETYSVTSAIKEYIYLEAMGTWESGDVLEVDYVYVAPFNFLLVGVTARIRYQQPYVLPEADAILITPYWAKPGPDDVFTALAQEQIGRAVVNPSITSGNDEISAYFDLSKLLHIIDLNGTRYEVGIGKDAEIYGRNEIKWNVTKPSVNYTAQFTYHPTVTALTNLHSLRNSENKSFVNRVSVRMMDHVHEKVVF